MIIQHEKKANKKKVLFIADFFSNEIIGGGEFCNDVLIRKLDEKYDMLVLKSERANIDKILKHDIDFFIVSNFVGLPQDVREFLIHEMRYLIYEHDHKYVKSRNPALYKNCVVPSNMLINQAFYRNAEAVLCQSKLHTEIVRKNLGYDNIHNLGGNLWHEQAYTVLKQLADKPKEKGTSAVLDSSIKHKNTKWTEKFCIRKGRTPILIKDSNIFKFYDKLGSCESFSFYPKTPETFSRIVAEARMMNVKVYTNKLVGALSEDWFNRYRGKELIDFLKDVKEKEIVNKVVEIVDNGL